MAEVARDHYHGAVTGVLLAFVLARGGSLGAIEVGMLASLAAAGIRPELVVGASVGAINGAHYAADPTRSGVERLRGIWQRVARADVFPFSALGVLKGLLGSRQSLLDSAPLRALLERNLPGGSLEESAIPCVVTATDALDGSEVILRTGPTVEALLALPTPELDQRGSVDQDSHGSRTGDPDNSERARATSSWRLRTSASLRRGSEASLRWTLNATVVTAAKPGS